MNRITPAFALASAVAACLPWHAALAQGLPAGARQWITAAGNHIDSTSPPPGYVQAMPYPSLNYATSADVARGYHIWANGDSTANALRSAYSLSGTDGVFHYNSMVDTYTISGPAGTEGTPVPARLRVHLTGTIFVAINRAVHLYLGSSQAIVKVGDWNPDPSPSFYEGFRVSPWGADFQKSVQINFNNYGTTQPTLEVDLLIDQTVSRTVGQPFDVAFNVTAQGYGAGDLSDTPAPAQYLVGTIDWILPDGYSVSSVLGWAPFCAADYNQDGFVTGDDFDAFTVDFDAGNAAADVNHDGFVTGDDFDYFAQHFDAGC